MQLTSQQAHLQQTRIKADDYPCLSICKLDDKSWFKLYWNYGSCNRQQFFILVY